VRWYLSFFSDTYYLTGLKTSLILAVIATVVSTVADFRLYRSTAAWIL